MTTTVKVTAHCSKDKEVHIRIDDGDNTSIQSLQDTESAEVYAYDNRIISVSEVLKPINQSKEN